MVFVTEPRLDYKPTSKVVFRHGNLLEELRVIRLHHASPVNQIIHILSVTVSFALIATTLFLIGRLFTFPPTILIFIVILCFPLPYLGFYFYLDPVISIFWMPLFGGTMFGGFIAANFLADLMPFYAAIPLSFALALLALLPQLFGHLLLEKVRSPLFEFFQFAVMTAFFLGYCGLGWISCWQVRKATIEKIWHDEACYASPRGEGILPT